MADVAQSKKPPKGAPPKGGTRFPRYELGQAVKWAKRLVSKTHQNPQPKEVVYAAVIEAKGTIAEIKVSTLKQFDLLQGESSAYDSTDLAKEINSSPDDEVQPLLARAALSPEIFKNIFNTFEGSSYTKSKVRQRALELKVHPDNVDKCIDIYCDSLAFAGLVVIEGDNIIHRSLIAVTSQANEAATDSGETLSPEISLTDDNQESNKSDVPINGISQGAIFNVSVTLDSSLDIEKLEKHLALLKRYGVI